ncbi:RluA family pseudouridine synthase [Anaerosacchariphilus polymeriproducens]|uniref:RNA pseudouridylate synthase n=1 Tax=Anaerosacchariphilus polymeriproducens TaxID=1812858 RepID=A0A371AY96_9FIRM|nr:RNA pseudouridine synthase [Anaerosacchariphilus polymeriproducens]RDU24472.1 RNA pseudouridine synthase [Anaerosacchariphilus polymeriproducens]
MAKLNVIFEDDAILVCKKEAGIPTQSAKVSEKDMVSIAKGYLFEKNFQKGEPYLGLIHRLDQPVEGILLLAKTPESAKLLSRQIQEGKMQKKYLAVTCGHISQKKDVLTNYLIKENRSNLSKVVGETVKDAKLAKLEYIILEEKGEQNLVEINLFTGRHHQIRVQLAHIGMPLWGDTKYNPLFKERSGWFQIALCAYQLEFEHPITNKKMIFNIMPTSDSFKKFDFIKKKE